MRKRVLSFVLILSILFSNIGSEIVFAEGEEELFEAEKVQLDEEVQSDEEVQVNEEVQLDEETTDETEKIAYNIYFDGLREDNETWIYTNESEYSIEVNTEELPDEEGEIVWEILDSETDENLETGWKAEYKKIIFLGKELKEYAGRIISVKASMYLQETDTYLTCDTILHVRDTKISWPEEMKNQYCIQETWSYKDTIDVDWECGEYPEGEVVPFHIDDIKSSDEDIVSISFDENTGEWKFFGESIGSTEVVFYLSMGEEKYQIEQKIDIYCDHKIKIEDYQIERIISQASSWLGINEKKELIRRLLIYTMLTSL